MRRCIFLKTAARYHTTGRREPEWIICAKCQRLLRGNAIPDRVLDRVRMVFGSRSPRDKPGRDPEQERDVRGRKLRVYGWTWYRKECPPVHGHCHTREIVAARSMKEAARIAGRSDPRSLDMCETGNKKEIEAATSNPGTIYWKPLDSWNGAWTRAG